MCFLVKNFRGSRLNNTFFSILRRFFILYLNIVWRQTQFLWRLICQNQRYNRYFQLCPNRKRLLSCSSDLVLTIWNKGAIVVVTKQWHFFFRSLSKFPVSSLHRRAICLSWGPGASAHSGAYFPDNTVISCKPSHWQMNLPHCSGARGLFSAINLINILIMNLDDSTIRLSGFQTWPLW